MEVGECLDGAHAKGDFQTSGSDSWTLEMGSLTGQRSITQRAPVRHTAISFADTVARVGGALPTRLSDQAATTLGGWLTFRWSNFYPPLGSM